MHYKHGLFYSLFLLSLIMYLFLLLLHIFSSYLLFVSFIPSKTINSPLITQSLSASSSSFYYVVYFFLFIVQYSSNNDTFQDHSNDSV